MAMVNIFTSILAKKKPDSQEPGFEHFTILKLPEQNYPIPAQSSIMMCVTMRCSDMGFSVHIIVFF
jgi:hypothetical protein